MAMNNFDLEDVPSWGALVLGIISLTGFGTLAIAGNGLDGQFAKLFGEVVTWDAVLVLVGGLAIMATNGMDAGGIIDAARGDARVTRGDDMVATIAQAGILGIIVVPILMIYVPGFSSFVTGSVAIGGAVSAVVVAGAGLAAYAN